MKIESINFVKHADMPARVVRTETGLAAAAILVKLVSAPAGTGISVKLSGAKKWTRYALQKRLQKLGAANKPAVKNITVREQDGVFWVRAD